MSAGGGWGAVSTGTDSGDAGSTGRSWVTGSDSGSVSSANTESSVVTNRKRLMRWIKLWVFGKVAEETEEEAGSVRSLGF